MKSLSCSRTVLQLRRAGRQQRLKLGNLTWLLTRLITPPQAERALGEWESWKLRRQNMKMIGPL